MIRLGVALRSSSLGDHVIQYEPREIGYLTARQWARAKRMTVQEMAAGYDCANRLRRNEAVEDITLCIRYYTCTERHQPSPETDNDHHAEDRNGYLR